MTSWAKVGAKCVCVDDAPSRKSGVMTRHLIKGHVYVIKAIKIETLHHYATHEIQTGVSVFLSGIDSPTGYLIDRFRPLITKTQEQDVAMFLSILSPTKVSDPQDVVA